MCILVLCVGQGEEVNHNMEIHNFISSASAGQWWSRFGRGRGPGGVLELFFDGVSGPRSGTPTHI